MAQMPPKAPSMATNWPDFSHHGGMGAAAHHNSSWVDEFLDFSAAKRGSHRRSISDSVAFLEMPLEQCRRVGNEISNTTTATNATHHHEFERFDDEQLMSMFTDDVPGPTMSSSSPSSTSDHNSFDGDNNNNNNNNMLNTNTNTYTNNTSSPPSGSKVKQLKSEPEEVQSFSKSSEEQFGQPIYDNSSEKIVDPKRIKRILANRQSAQRSRVRKLHYISELERSVTSLQAEVSVLSPRVAFFDHQRMVLTVDNGVLKQRIAALAQDKIFKDAHQEALKREIERLRQIYYQQNLKKMESGTTTSPPPPPHSTSPPTDMDKNAPPEKDQLVN